MRVATPCTGQQLAQHFGHASEFVFFDADPSSGEITNEQVIASPPHQPGLLPQWLADHGAEVILAAGMGGRARQLFDQHGIEVVVGVSAGTAREAVEAYLKGTLVSGSNPCDH
jgi:predicted Fe-Mo cluster-binding NifX family protein